MAFCFPRGSEDFVTIIAFLSVDVFQKEDSDSSREISFCYWTELGSTAKTIYWHCIVVRESTAFIAKKKKKTTKNQQQQHTNHTQERNMGSWCSKDLNSPMAFREDHKACDQLAHGSLISWYRGNTVTFQEPWSQVALACSSLKQDLGSQAEFEVRLWWEHWILATRPVVSDKGSWPFSLAEKNFHKDGTSWSK